MINQYQNMFLVVPMSNFIVHNINFIEKKKNNIMVGLFTKIFYLDSNIASTSLYLPFPITRETDVTNHGFQITRDERSACGNGEVLVSNNYHNKYRGYNISFFDNGPNKLLFHDIRNIERDILNHYNEFFDISKSLVYSITNQLSKKQIKYYLPNPLVGRGTFVLKISGVWETEKHIGINYKFIEV